jgi:hypothetical protein
MVKVYYNGIDAFSGISATPFIGISDEIINYAQRWGVAQNISLNGLITGSCNDSFNDIIAKQQQLFDNFGQDFKEVKIIDNNVETFVGKYVKVKDISFDQSAYIRTANFKINLEVYPESLFSGTFGVTDPSSDIKYTEQQDGTVSITRSFSAKGFNTSSTQNNALNNAITYVRSLTGSAEDIITPKFIALYPNLTNLCPRKISENINRMDGTYGVNIDYILRKGASTTSIFQYDIDTSYDDERGLYTVTLRGSLNGGICKTMQQLRQEFLTFNPFALTFAKFKQITNYPYLNPEPDSFSVNENPTDNIIDFNYSYTSNPQKIKFDYSIDISNEYPTDQVAVNFNGTFTADGPQLQRLPILENELQKINIVPLCQKFYLENVKDASLPMNVNPKSYKVTRDITQSTINIQASFDNGQFPPSDFKSFTWNVSISPSIRRYNPIQFLNGDNGFFDLNYYNRGKITVQGSAIIASNADRTNDVRQQALQILNNYAAGFSSRVRSEDKVDRKLKAEENGYVYNFTLTDTCETPIFSI